MSKKKNLSVELDKFNQQARDKHEPVRALDLAEQMLSGYNKNLEICIQDGIKQRHGDFFVVVLRKRERIADRIVRSIFLHRLTCPTPNYDQIVYHYSRADNKLEELWVIPDKESCITLKSNVIEAAKHEKELLKYVLDFSDGTLGELMRKYNGEKEYSLELEEDKLKEIRQ